MLRNFGQLNEVVSLSASIYTSLPAEKQKIKKVESIEEREREREREKRERETERERKRERKREGERERCWDEGIIMER